MTDPAKKIKRQGKIIPADPTDETPKGGFVPHPIADLALTSKLFDFLQQALVTKQVRKGTNETLKFVSKDQVEAVIMAANAQPPELLASIPLICEERSIPYCFVPDAAALGRACGIKRPIICCCIIRASTSTLNEQLGALRDKIELLFYS